MSINTLKADAKTAIDEMTASVLKFFIENDPFDPETEVKAKAQTVESIRAMGKRLYDIASVLETCSEEEADMLLNGIKLQEAIVAMWTLTGKLATTGECNECEKD